MFSMPYVWGGLSGLLQALCLSIGLITLGLFRDVIGGMTGVFKTSIT